MKKNADYFDYSEAIHTQRAILPTHTNLVGKGNKMHSTAAAANINPEQEHLLLVTLPDLHSHTDGLESHAGGVASTVEGNVLTLISISPGSASPMRMAPDHAHPGCETRTLTDSEGAPAVTPLPAAERALPEAEEAGLLLLAAPLVAPVIAAATAGQWRGRR